MNYSILWVANYQMLRTTALAYLEKNNRLILYNDLIDYFTNLSNQNKIKYYGLKELNKFIHKNQ